MGGKSTVFSVWQQVFKVLNVKVYELSLPFPVADRKMDWSIESKIPKRTAHHIPST